MVLGLNRGHSNISHTEAHPMLEGGSNPDSQNALDVMSKAGALFDVHYPSASWENGIAPVVAHGKNEGEPLYKWVVRQETGEPLGLHSGAFVESGSYRHVGEMAEKMFPNSTLNCTVFGKGERMALTQQISDPIDLGGGDVIQPSIMWVSSFNAQWSTAVFDMIGRLFCTNQLIGQTPLFSVKHTRNHDVTFEQRTHVLTKAIERAEVVGRMAVIMKDQEFTDDQFHQLTKQIVPRPPFILDENGVPTDRIHGTAEKRMIANRGAMKTMWQKECAEFGNVDGTEQKRVVFDGNKWLAYNAVQGAEQHNINSRFSKTTAARERALTRSVDGRTPYAERAWDLLNAN